MDKNIERERKVLSLGQSDMRRINLMYKGLNIMCTGFEVLLRFVSAPLVLEAKILNILNERIKLDNG